ncbi:permease [Bacillus cytotoxicus]|uniref:permease n=1 Tax=Bacillus cereus group sp. BfR-BA-01492 TaxID=2920361 RepID=UPI001F58EB06|nr:permease [Bacillus cereus group sp. BfR-BA-01492]
MKAKSPKIPLWALMLSTQLLDVIFVPLYVLGIETMIPVGNHGYGEVVIHADYSHSFVGALSIAWLASIVAGRCWERRGGYVIGAVVFSHWILDLLVHRIDLPLFPGNFGNLPLLGLGLWKIPEISMVLECLLIILGGFLYFRFVVSSATKYKKPIAQLAGGIVVTLLILSFITDIFGFAS